MKSFFCAAIGLLIVTACRKSPAPQQGGVTNTDTLPPITDKLLAWAKDSTDMSAIVNLYFSSAANGFCAARNGMYSTTDSGKTWKAIAGGRGYDVFFLDRQHGYFVTSQSFGITTDGGTTWNIMQPIPFGPDAGHVFFVTPSTGFVTTPKGLYKTTDAGTNWTLVNSQQCQGVYFADAQKGWIGSEKGIYETTNGGVSFTQRAGHDSVRNVYMITFADPLHGWANANTSATYKNDYLFKTSDGGATWQRLPMARTVDMQLLAKDVVYTVNDNGVYRSGDGGGSWSRILKPDVPRLIEVFFISERLGWAGDGLGNIYRLRQ